jgi:hypothetical protein
MKPSRLSHPLTSKSVLLFIYTLIHSYIQIFCIIHTIHTYRYTVSNVLSKYAFTSGVDPLFIQSMFTYLRKNDVTIPEIAVNLTFKACNEIVSSRVYRALLLISQCMYVCITIVSDVLYVCMCVCVLGSLCGWRQCLASYLGAGSLPSQFRWSHSLQMNLTGRFVSSCLYIHTCQVYSSAVHS